MFSSFNSVMKKLVVFVTCIFAYEVQAIEYETQFENDQFDVVKVKVMPGEELALHRNEYPQVVIALKGQTVLRVEGDNLQPAVAFPTGVAVYRDISRDDMVHTSINTTQEPVELVVVQVKK